MNLSYSDTTILIVKVGLSAIPLPYGDTTISTSRAMDFLLSLLPRVTLLSFGGMIDDPAGQNLLQYLGDVWTPEWLEYLKDIKHDIGLRVFIGEQLSLPTQKKKIIQKLTTNRA